MQLSLLVAVGLTGSALACQVPVFRYALERWNPDLYRVLVLAPKPLSSSELAIQERWVGAKGKSRVNVEVIDVSQTSDERVKKIWGEFGGAENRPLIVALYPDKSSLKGQLAHTSEFNGTNVQRMAASPVRKQISQRLAEGHSAVWVLLESGNKQKDAAASKMLNEQLAKDKQWLKLPSPEELEIKPEVLSQVKVKLQIEFSVVSVQRDDPQEQFLVDCLLNSESDLRSIQDEPLAFPVFGRGIVLYALAGKGIAPETIRSASSFICGPCSCQVKEQNPGFDLLLDHDWESALGSDFISQPEPGAGSSASPKLIPIPPGRKTR